MKYNFCEFYTCCKKNPCVHGYAFQKNHDFNLDYKIQNNKHIVLYRNDIILQIESYYRYTITRNNKPYVYNNLINFIKNKRPYYNKFVKKWVNKDRPNVLVVEYYDLIHNPIEYIHKIFKFIHPGLILDNKIINNILDVDFMIKNKSCINNNKKNKIGELNKMDPELYDKIKDELKINKNSIIQKFHDQNILETSKLILTFVNNKYIEIFDIFYTHFSKLNIPGLIVVSLDKNIYTYLRNKNINTILIEYNINNKNKFWKFRLNIINSFFKVYKKDIIHTDCDCFWLKNIIEIIDKIEDDMIFSIGTTFPKNVYNKLGSVVCCGFYYIRYNNKTENIINNLLKKYAVINDDQILFNKYILQNKTTLKNYKLSENNYILNKINTVDNISISILRGSIISREIKEDISNLYCYHPYFKNIPDNKKIESFRKILDISII